MTRRRSHPVLPSLLALALIADTVTATRDAWHSTTVTVWLTAAVLGYGAMLAAIWALVTAWHAARVAPYRRARRRLYRPAGRPQPGTGLRPVAPVDGRHARTLGALAAPPMRDAPPVTVPAVTAGTVPMRVVGVRMPPGDWFRGPAGIGRRPTA